MTIHDIFDQVCNDSDLYPYFKQFKLKYDGRGTFYSIYARQLGTNHANVTASEAEAVLQILTNNSKKKAWNQEKYLSHHLNYHVILENLKKYSYSG